MTRSGIVTQVNRKNVCLMTSTGEFVKVRLKDTIPSIGEVYNSEVYVEKAFYKSILIAASLLIFILSAGSFYSYYTPVAAITIEINPSVKLQVNRWDRIIKAEPLNKDGESLLGDLNLKNINLNAGLVKIVEAAEEDKFITAEYKSSGKEISIYIDEKSSSAIDVSKFESSVKNKDLKVRIQSLNDREQTIPSTKAINENIKDKNNSDIDNGNLEIPRDKSTKNNDTPSNFEDTKKPEAADKEKTKKPQEQAPDTSEDNLKDNVNSKNKAEQNNTSQEAKDNKQDKASTPIDNKKSDSKTSSSNKDEVKSNSSKEKSSSNNKK